MEKDKVVDLAVESEEAVEIFLVDEVLYFSPDAASALHVFDSVLHYCIYFLPL